MVAEKMNLTPAQLGGGKNRNNLIWAQILFNSERILKSGKGLSDGRFPVQ